MSDLKQKVLRYLFSPDDWANGKNPMKHRGTAMSNARHICKYPCHASTCEKQKLLDRIAQLEAAQPTEEQIEAEITPEVFTAGRMAFQANARNSGGQKIRAVYKAMRLKSLQLTEGEE